MEIYQGPTVSGTPLISRSPSANYCGIIVPQRPAELQHCGHNGSVTSRQSTGQQAVPLAEMLREGGQTDSSTARRLFHCCRLRTVALSQTGIYADRLVLEECNGYCGYQETGATVTTSRVTTGGGTRKKLQADCLLT
ncbi:hypothetical protein JOQ06_021926, partial [Pogonophryne albipinna]